MNPNTTIRITAAYLLLLAAKPTTADDQVKVVGGHDGGDDGLSCPSFGWTPGSIPEEHLDTACNRLQSNDPKRAFSVMKALEQSIATGKARRLQPEHTWFCPADDGNAEKDDQFDETNPHHLTQGPSSVWILQNRATVPVVVSWLAPAKVGDVDTSFEVSAVNHRIAPAHKDPNAILQPGEWKSIDVKLGQLFNVRELDASAGGEPAPGRVLLRHRPGPIHITNRLGPKHLDCPVQALIDPKPVQPPPPKDENELPPPKVDQKRPDFDSNKRCNAQAKMFRSEVPCPIDVFYVGVDTDYNVGSGHPMPKDYLNMISGTELDKTGTDEDDAENAAALSASSDSMSDSSVQTHHPSNPAACHEHHSFHLGVNPAANPDDRMGQFELWDSPVAYLFTYVSHKFVARTRHDKTLVDEINVERTVVGDCPRQRKRALVEAKTESVPAEIEVQIGSVESEQQCKVNVTNTTINSGITKGDIVETVCLKNDTSAAANAKSNVPIDPKRTAAATDHENRHKAATATNAGSP